MPTLHTGKDVIEKIAANVEAALLKGTPEEQTQCFNDAIKADTFEGLPFLSSFALVSKETAFVPLAMKKNDKAIDFLLAHGGSMDNALFAYAMAGNIEKVQSLIAQGANRIYAIQGYYQSNRPELIKAADELKKSRIDNNYALRAAAIAGNDARVKELLASSDVNPLYALRGYAIKGDMKKAEEVFCDNIEKIKPHNLALAYGLAGQDLPESMSWSHYRDFYKMGLAQAGHLSKLTADERALGIINDILIEKGYVIGDAVKLEPAAVGEHCKDLLPMLSVEQKKDYILGAISGGHLNVVTDLLRDIPESEINTPEFKEAVCIACWKEDYDISYFGQRWSDGATHALPDMPCKAILLQLVQQKPVDAKQKPNDAPSRIIKSARDILTQFSLTITKIGVLVGFIMQEKDLKVAERDFANGMEGIQFGDYHVCPNASHSNNITVLNDLVSRKQDAAIDFLLAHGGSIDNAVLAYAHAGNMDKVNELMQKGANRIYAIQGYIRSGREELIQRAIELCENRIDMNYALRAAASMNNDVLVNALLKKTPTPNPLYALRGYAIAGNMDKVKAIYRANLDKIKPHNLVLAYGLAGKMLPESMSWDFYRDFYHRGLAESGFIELMDQNALDIHEYKNILMKKGFYKMKPDGTPDVDLQSCAAGGHDTYFFKELTDAQKMQAILGAIGGGHLSRVAELLHTLSPERVNTEAFKRAVCMACWSEDFDVAFFGQRWGDGSKFSFPTDLTCSQILEQLIAKSGIIVKPNPTFVVNAQPKVSKESNLFAPLLTKQLTSSNLSPLPSSVRKRKEARLTALIDKMSLDYAQNMDSAVIQNEFKLLCKIAGKRRNPFLALFSPYSTSTESAKHIIERLESNATLCLALGISGHTAADRKHQIEKLMHDAFKDHSIDDSVEMKIQPK